MEKKRFCAQNNKVGGVNVSLLNLFFSNFSSGFAVLNINESQSLQNIVMFILHWRRRRRNPRVAAKPQQCLFSFKGRHYFSSNH